jgi:FKBP-type peptidyl-prolyl cis-trans isomerase SlyD
MGGLNIPIEKSDIVKLTYTAITDDGIVFDTTDEEIAKVNDIYDEKGRYGPITIVVGQGHVVPGLDANMIGQDAGEEQELLLTPEEAFGPRRGELVETVAVKRFKEKPQPGQRVQIDNRVGTIQSVVGGRARVDFNPPLAGIAVTYNYKVVDIITDKVAKIGALIEVYHGEPMEWSQQNEILDIEVPYRLTFDQRWMLSKKNLADAMLEMEGIEKVRFMEIYETPKPDEEKPGEAVSDKETKKEEKVKSDKD